MAPRRLGRTRSLGFWWPECVNVFRACTEILRHTQRAISASLPPPPLPLRPSEPAVIAAVLRAALTQPALAASVVGILLDRFLAGGRMLPVRATPPPLAAPADAAAEAAVRGRYLLRFFVGCRQGSLCLLKSGQQGGGEGENIPWKVRRSRMI